MLETLFTATIIVNWLAVNKATASDGCRRVEFAPEIDGRFLMNHTIKRTIVPSKDHCQINCYLDSACVSYNYGPTENDALICELNDRTHLQVSRDDFVWKPGYVYRYNMLVLEGEWTLHKGFHYALFTEKVTWNTADAFCKIAFGGQLVKIESVEENSFIKSQYLSDKVDYWIGLSDSVEEGDWNWVDGTNSTGYTNWGNGQPNDSNGQDCAGIRMGTYSDTNYDAQWHDNSCLKTKGFICRK